MPQSQFIDKLVANNSLTFTTPIVFKRHTAATSPQNAATQPNLTPLQQALIRGHRWLNQLETGKAHSFRDIAKQNNLDERYVSRMLNMTRLSPDITKHILEDTLPDSATIAKLSRNTPRFWHEQYNKFLHNNSALK